MAETQTDPEEIVVVPLPSDVPLAKISPPATPSGQMKGLPNMFDQRMDPANSAIQQSGTITESAKKTTGIAFSGGGIRSAAFCSGALRKMLQDDVPLEHLSCVSGGGYTGAAFLDWKRRPENRYNKTWHKEFFDTMRKNAGYMCNWRSPWLGIWDSFVFIVLLLFVVLILPCILWLPYSLPVALAVDVLFGGILRENSTCPPSVKVGARTSFLVMELYDDCQPPARRLALFLTTIIASLVFFVLSRIKQLVGYKGPLRLLSTLSGMVFVFTAFPWVAHDFLWPSRTWIKALIFIICLVLPFFFPIIRKYAGIFLGFYAYTYIVSWKVFRSELFGAVPYSDEVFYPVLMGCAIALIAFPFIGSIHQSAFNVYYRYRLSKAFFFKSKAGCRCEDVFPWCVRSVDGISHLIRDKGFRGDDEDDTDKEPTLQNLDGLLPIFISNITVNDWQIDSGAESSHQLMSFSSEGVKRIGKDVENGEKELPDFKCFKPKHMRLSAAMAISGAAVSFDMGSYESGPLDMVLDLLNLLGIGMGDELVCDQRQHEDTSTSRFRKYGVPILVEISCFLPLIALPFVYWLGHSKDWVEYLVLVHVVVVLVLSGFAVVKTGSTKPGKWERFIRWWITHIFFVRFVRGFLNINNVGTNPPQVLRLSDGGHFENLALLPLLDKKLEKIVIFDGSCNPGDESKSLLIALNLAREKLHCSFVGENGRDINEDIRVNFLKSKSQQQKWPRYYKFHVQYYDGKDKQGKGEILFIVPRHPSKSISLKKIIDEEPKPWDIERPSEAMPLKTSIEEQPRPWDAELGLDPKEWGESPELTEREADRLTFCCCHCCHYYGSSHCISDGLIGRFPYHTTANQFFTPDTFSAYHREGYAACVEADVAEFLTKQTTQDS